MKKAITLCLFCSAGTRMAHGRSRQRRRLESSLADSISKTEIGHALMSSRPVKVGIEPEDAPPCSSPSAKWLKEQASELSDEDLENFFDWHIYSLSFAYKLFVEPTQNAYIDEHSSFDGQHGTSSSQEYFGLDGQYTQEVQLIHDQAQDFWSDSGVDDDIRILCAHGSDLADRHKKLLPTLEVLFGDDYDEDYTIYDHATDIQDLILRLPGGYNFPLLTFNAFATEQVDESNDFPAIIIGDGYFEFQESVGLSSEGPEYALTHEHAHHLQFALGVHQEEDQVDPTQVTRRQELLADALSAYFLAHDMGGDMEPEEILNVHTVAYSVGDCEEDHDGHHGTPRQRWCATHWGATLADDQEFGGEAIELSELKERFDAWYERVDDLDELCGYSASSAAAFSKNFQVVNSLQAVAIAYGVASVLGF